MSVKEGGETNSTAQSAAKHKKLPLETLEAPTHDLRRRLLISYPPTALALLSKSRFVVGGGGGAAKTGVPNRVTLFMNESAKLIQKCFLDFEDDRVVGLTAHPKRDVVLCTTVGGQSHLINVSDKELKIIVSKLTGRAWEGPDKPGPSQRAVAFDAPGETIAMSLGSNVVLWKCGSDASKLEKFKELATSDCHSEDIRDVVFQPKTGRLLTVDDAAAAIWDIQSGARLCVVRPEEFLVAEADLRLMLGGHCMLRYQEHAENALLSHGPRAGPVKFKFRAGAFSPDGNILYTAASAARGGHVAMRGIDAEGKAEPAGRVGWSCPHAITAMAAGPSYVVAGTAEGEVALLSGERLKLRYKKELHHFPVSKVGLLMEGDGKDWRAESTGVAVSISLDKSAVVSFLQEAMLAREARVGWMMLLLVLFLVVVAVGVFHGPAYADELSRRLAAYSAGDAPGGGGAGGSS